MTSQREFEPIPGYRVFVHQTDDYGSWAVLRHGGHEVMTGGSDGYARDAIYDMVRDLRALADAIEAQALPSAPGVVFGTKPPRLTQDVGFCSLDALVAAIAEGHVDCGHADGIYAWRSREG